MYDHDPLTTSCENAGAYSRRNRIIGRGRVSRKAVPVLIAGLAIGAAGGLGLAASPAAYAASTAGECISGQACGPNGPTTLIATSVSLSSSSSEVTLPAAPTLTATVSADSDGDEGPVPGGTVQFSDSATGTIGSASVVNGQASLTTSSLALGANTITADYNGYTEGIYYFVSTASAPITVSAENPMVAGSLWSFAKSGASGTQLLEVNNNSTADGGVVDTWQQVMSRNATQANEVWVYQPSSANPGYGQLVNQNSGLCLEVNGASGAVDQWGCVTGADNELWQEVTNPSGGDSLQVLSSGQYLGTTSANGAPVSSGDGNQLVMQSSQSAYTAWSANANDPLAPANTVWSFAKSGASGTQLLEVKNNSTADGGVVDTWQQVMSGNSVQANEVWVYQPSSANSGYGQLVNQNSGLCLEVNGASGAVDQWSCVTGATNELWTEVDTVANGDSLQVLSSGAYLGTTSANGAPVSSGDGNQLVMQSSQSAYTAWTATAQS
jgi:hypothetical protein